MDWRWNWLWSIFWNAFIHAVLFQWTELQRDGENLKGWWRSLWSEIENRVNGVRSWAQGQISWLQGYAFGLYVQTVSLVYSTRDTIYGVVGSWVNDVRNWASGQLSWLQGYAFGLYLQVRAFAQSIVNAVYSWARPYIDNAIAWVRSIYEWVQPFRDLITNWLVGARAVIDWLWHYAWGQLQAFLSNPVGYVLGWLLTPITNLINWWQLHGSGLMDFVTNELPGLRNLLARGFAFLATFIDRPGQTILDLLTPIFLDWLEGLIADNW